MGETGRPDVQSDIPEGVSTRVVSEFSRNENTVTLQTVECLLDGEVVGHRFHDDQGRLLVERPMRAGRLHGTEYHWHENGSLSAAEPHENGKQHGTARQWDEDGRLLGTYTLEHGTGYDIWRGGDCSGGVHVAEVHAFRDGKKHGPEWWLEPDGRSVHWERHWFEGLPHGIERRWNERGRLRRGHPRYWVRNERVTKRQYQRACRTDASLPPFEEDGQRPERSFPEEIVRAIAETQRRFGVPRSER